jgi:hypothetical protein
MDEGFLHFQSDRLSASLRGKQESCAAHMSARPYEVRLKKMTADCLTTYVRNRRKARASGVKISIELTYLGYALKSTRDLRKVWHNLDVISAAPPAWLS